MDDFEPPFESYSTTFPFNSISSRRKSSVVAGASQHVAIRPTSTTDLQDDLISFLSYVKTENIPILPVTKPDIRTVLGHGASFLVNGAVMPTTYVDPVTGKMFPEGMTVALKRADPNSNTVIGRLPVIFNELVTMHHPPLRAHPNIVNLLGVGFEIEGPPHALSTIPVLIPECAELGNLAEVLETARKEDRALSFDEKLSLCIDVAHGLEILHRCDIVHGDVKCENILIFEREGKDEAHQQGFNMTCKLTDFGVLRHPDTENGVQLGGSPPWQAPECSRGHFFEVEDAKRTDIYSFGMLLWRLFLDGDPFGLLQESSLVVYSNDDSPRMKRIKRNDAIVNLKHTDVLVKHVCDSFALSGKFTRSELEMLCEVIEITLVNDASRRELSLSRIIRLLSKDQWFEPRHPLPPSRIPLRFLPNLLDIEKWHSEFESASPVVLELLALGLKEHAEASSSRNISRLEERRSAAAYQLAVCYANGFGVPFDGAECIHWLASAAEQGSQKAAEALPKIIKAVGKSETVITAPTQRAEDDAKLSSSWASESFASGDTKIEQVRERGDDNQAPHKRGPDQDISKPGFLGAAEACHYNDIRHLLQEGATPSVSEDNVSPLHFLSLWNLEEARTLGQKLIRAGADVNTISKPGKTVGGTPLMWSVFGDHKAHTKVLLNLGADPLIETRNGEDALSFAARLHLASHLRLLMEHIRPVQLRGQMQRLLAAAAGGESRFTRMLRHQGNWKQAALETLALLMRWNQLFDDELDFDNMIVPAIHVALRSNYGRMNADIQTQFIKALGVDASQMQTLLRDTVLSYNLDLFNSLIDLGVPVTKTFEDGKTPLHLCAKIPDHNLAATEFAPRLLDLGAKVDVADDHGLTPWMAAILERKWDLADLLMRKGAEPLAVDNDGFNVLGLCIKAINLGSLKYLMKYCAKKEVFHHESFIVNQRKDISALQLAASLSLPRSHGMKIEVLGTFLTILTNYTQAPGQLTYRSDGILSDASALDIAVSGGNVHVVKNLVKKGAHRDAKDRSKALDIARQRLKEADDGKSLYCKNLERCFFIMESWDDKAKDTRRLADDWTNMRTIDESHVKSSWDIVIWSYKDRPGVHVAA